MSKMGIGSFFGGFADGYQKGAKLEMEREKAERDKQEFEFRRQQMELEKTVKEETTRALTELEGRFRAPPPAPGAIKDPNAPAVEPMSEPEYYYERAKVIAGAGIRLGKFNLADEKALRDTGREMKFDNFRDAVKHAYSNPDDVPGIQKKLKKAGIELPEGIRFQTVPMDPNDPQSDRDLVGFVMGKDGKPQKVFSYMDSVPMFAASEVLTQDALDTKKGLRGQRFTSRENELNRANKLEVQLLENDGKAAAAGTKKDPQKELRDVLEGRFKAVLANPSNALQSASAEAFRNKVSRAAEAAVATGRYGIYEAIDAAFNKYKDEDPSIFKKK